MRMRRKKHREERLSCCGDYIVSNITDYKEDIKAIFKNKRKPLHIEIGCGKGAFVCGMAKLYPDVNFLAIEKNPDVLLLAAEKVKAEELKNVRLVLGDASFLNEFDSKSKCDRIYINFCDPWHKYYQRKRRLTYKTFLEMYKKILKRGGEVHFKTDNSKLFEFSLNSFSDFGLRMKNITFDLHNSKMENNVMTEYEKNFSEKGFPIYRCEVKF